MDKLAHTWALMRSSWEVLRKDKELLVFPLLSGVVCLAIVATFVVPLAIELATEYKGGPPTSENLTAEQVARAFLFYFLTYFVVAFFNASIVACALERMRGGDPTVRWGLAVAWSRLAVIVEWALVSATVGMLLRAVQRSSRGAARLGSGVLGAAWSIGTFLVVPILVVKGIGPLAAIRESVRLLKKTWGPQLIGTFSFRLVTALLSVPLAGVLIAGALVLDSSVVAGVTLAALGLSCLVLLALVQSVLETILQAAVYVYAWDGRVPSAFDRHVLESSFGR